MPFELIMLLGFFGTVLLTLLPAAPAKTDENGFRLRHGQRRSDRGREAARYGRTVMRKEASRHRRAGSAAA